MASRKARADARNKVMSKPDIRNAIMSKAKDKGTNVTRSAVDTFIDTYKKTKVGPIQRAIADFFKSSNKSSGGGSGGGRTASQVKAIQTERNQRDLAKRAAKSPTGTVLSDKTKTRTAAAEKRLQDGIKAQQATKKPKRMGGEVTYTGSGPKKPTTTSYKIKSGDTLSAIAARNETTVAALKKLNNIKDANKISAGASLKIPKKVRPSMPKSRPKRK
jgi:LysM repeat protein